jgi:NADPH-dependent curcumin reductase CurA
MAPKNKQVLLASRPTGAPKPSDFRIVETDIDEPGEGQVLVRNLWLSLDPYMRGRMNDARSYAPKVELGAVMVGGTVGEVVASRAPGLAEGDVVVANLGWQEYGIASAASLRKVEPSKLPLSAYLGAVGMPGVTAWYGLKEIGAPKPGETLVVAAAAGPVGAVVGQLAKILGCRAVGIAGGKEKCEHVVRDLGFDACLDHRDPELRARLRDATPDGIDIYFENVGGPILDLVLGRLNPFARIPLCGLVSQYNATEPYGVKGFASLLTNRVTLRGFIVSDHLDKWPAALMELAEHVAAGRITYRESIAEGLESAPEAFIGMLEGRNFGKQLVRLAQRAGG